MNVCKAHGKHNYTKKGAKQRLSEHKRALCAKCISGCYTWEIYQCHKGGKYKHTGHKRIKEQRLTSSAA
jgi:hypothetical protein